MASIGSARGASISRDENELGTCRANKARDGHHQVHLAWMPQPLGAALLAAFIGTSLNLHYVLLGRPLLEGLLTSRPVLALGNGVFGVGVRQAMTREGVPETAIWPFQRCSWAWQPPPMLT